MNVSFYTPWEDICGIAEYSRFLKDALEQTGVRVTIVPIPEHRSRSAYARVGRKLDEADLAHIQFEYSFFGHVRKGYSYLFEIMLNITALLGQIRKAKILTVHEIELLEVKGLRMSLIRMMQKRALRSVTHFVVHADIVRKKLLELGCADTKITVLPLPVPEIALQPGMDAVRAFKKRYSIEQRKVLTIFGFVSPRKGYEVVFDAIRSRDDCMLMIAGGAHPNDQSGYAGKLLRLAEDRGMRDRVRILGYLNMQDLAMTFAATDIVLAPYQSASASASLSMAAAFHKPVIASDIEPMQELAGQGMGMFLFEEGSASALAKEIDSCLSDEGKLRRLADMNRDFSVRHSYRNIGREMLRIYNKYAGGTRE